MTLRWMSLIYQLMHAHRSLFRMTTLCKHISLVLFCVGTTLGGSGALAFSGWLVPLLCDTWYPFEGACTPCYFPYPRGGRQIMLYG